MLLSQRGIDQRLCDLLFYQEILQNVDQVFGASKTYTPPPDPASSMEPGNTNWQWYVAMKDDTKWNITLFQYDYDREYEHTRRVWKQTDPILPVPNIQKKDADYIDYHFGLVLGYVFTDEEKMTSIPFTVLSFDRHYSKFLEHFANKDLENAKVEFNLAAECINETRRSYEYLSLLEERYTFMYTKLQELTAE